MKKEKLRKLVLGIALVAVLAIALPLGGGCAPAAEEGPAVDTWKIPALICITGAFAPVGAEFVFTYDYVEKEINDAGGIQGKPLHITNYDSANDPGKATAEMSKVVDDALVILGPQSALEAMGCMSMAVEEGVYCLASTWGYEESVKWEPWVFSAFPPSEEFAPPGPIWWAQQYPEIKTVVLFSSDIHPIWKNMTDIVAESLESQGIEIVGRVDIPFEAVDYAGLAVKALAYEADGYHFVGLSDSIAKIIIQMHQRADIDNEHILLFGTANTPDLFVVGEGYLEGVWHWEWNNWDSTAPRWLALKEAWLAENPDIPPAWCDFAYDQVLYLAAALEQTGVTGDPAKLNEERLILRDWFNNQEDFPFCRDTLDVVNGYRETKIYMMQVENNIYRYRAGPID